MNNSQALKELPAFYWAAKLLSISAAGEKLSVSKATVSKAIVRLEEQYQVRLFERNSRNIRLTAEGQTLLEYAERLLLLADEASHALVGMQSTPQGTVKLAAPLAFSREVLAPNLARFHQAFPEITLQIQTSQHPMDVLRDEVDIAVIVGSIESSDLIAKTLYPGKLKWVTSPEYFSKNGPFETPRELEEHIQYCETRYSVHKFVVNYGAKQYQLSLQNKNCCNDPIVVREALLNGCGISMLPEQYCKRLISKGSLIEVCTAITPNVESAHLKMVYPSRLFRSTRVRAVIQFLEEITSEI